MHSHLSVVLLPIFLVPTVKAGEPSSRTASSSVQLADAHLHLQLYEAIGPMELLKALDPARLEKLCVADRAAGAPAPEVELYLFAEYAAGASPAAPVTFNIGARLPFSQPNTHSSLGSGSVSITYGQIGATAKITLNPAASGRPDETSIGLNLKVTASGSGQVKPETTSYEKTVAIGRDKPVCIALDESPVATAEKGNANLRFARLVLESARPSGHSASTPAAVLPTSNTRIQFDCVQVTGSMERLSRLGHRKLLDNGPNAAELLKRLAQFGEPLQILAQAFEFEPSEGTIVSTVQREPTVTDVNISGRGTITPSITYEDVGAILEINGFSWQDAGKESIARVPIRLRSSGVALTSVQVAKGVKLPGFTQWRLEQSQQFRSRVPEYFIFRGPTCPADPQDNATLYIARVLLTRGQPE